jgi:hypothetical protein
MKTSQFETIDHAFADGRRGSVKLEDLKVYSGLAVEHRECHCCEKKCLEIAVDQVRAHHPAARLGSADSAAAVLEVATEQATLGYKSFQGMNDDGPVPFALSASVFAKASVRNLAQSDSCK